jgi:4-amino-4-deoxy-L-arabinose transferase-like glycosyltransferase
VWDRATTWVKHGREPLLVLLAVAAFAAIGGRWLVDARRGGPFDIDESGYQMFAVLHYRALEAGGLSGWWDSVMGPSIFAPLMPASLSVGFEAVGLHRSLGLFVSLAFACIGLLACYGLGHAVAGRRGGWITLAVAAATPDLIVYSRAFNFAIAALATAAVLLWALARSDRWLSPGWSALAGVGLGGLVLSRTMTVALVPALVLAAVLAVAAGPQRLRRAGNVLLSGVVALLVGGYWYYRNGEAVWDYLTSFGYGSRRAEYGSDESLFSTHSWRAMTDYVLGGRIGLPLTVVSLVSIAVLVVRSARHPGAEGEHRLVRWVRSPLMPSFLFAVWGVLMLTSTGNKGSGFLAPLVPAFGVLVAAALARSSRPLRWTLGTALVAVLLLNTAAYADDQSPLAEPRDVHIPGYGYAIWVDGIGSIQDTIDQGYPELPEDLSAPMTKARMRAYVAASRRLAAALDPSELNAFGFRHRLVNVNSIQLEQVLAGRPAIPITMIEPLEAHDEPTMQQWLSTGGAATACELMLATGTLLDFEPYPDQVALRHAARAVGFAPTDQKWRLPEGRVVTRWHRASCAPDAPE